jgi:DNA-binding NarL/FixJ family response regulator
MRVAPKVELNPEQAVVLEQQSRGRSIPARGVERSRIILLAASGKQDKEIASEMQISVQK